MDEGVGMSKWTWVTTAGVSLNTKGFGNSDGKQEERMRWWGKRPRMNQVIEEVVVNSKGSIKLRRRKQRYATGQDPGDLIPARLMTC